MNRISLLSAARAVVVYSPTASLRGELVLSASLAHLLFFHSPFSHFDDICLTATVGLPYFDDIDTLKLISDIAVYTLAIFKLGEWSVLALKSWRRTHSHPDTELIERRIRMREEIEKNLHSSRRFVDKPATETHFATGIEVVSFEDIIIRDIRRMDKFPDIDENHVGISPWFRLDPVGLYHRGIEVFLSDSRSLIPTEDGNWRVLPRYQHSEQAKYAATVGRIPFDFIERIDWSRSDGYYNSPHFYCRFAGPLRGPYEDVIYKVKLYPEVSEHFHDIGLRKESYQWGTLRQRVFLFRQDIIRWWRQARKSISGLAARLFISSLLACFLMGAASTTKNPLPPVGKQQAEPADQKATDAKTQTTKPEPIIIINNIPSAEQKSPPAKEPEQWPPMWTIVAGLAITGGASLIALWTVRNIKEQAQAATRAARATEQSAKAAADNVAATLLLANLERPWVMVYPGEPENWPTGDAIVPINFPIRTPVSEINYGRSPALVRKISISFKVLDWPIPDIPPDYATPDDIAPSDWPDEQRRV